jgi:hypothetical protein
MECTAAAGTDVLFNIDRHILSPQMVGECLAARTLLAKLQTRSLFAVRRHDFAVPSFRFPVRPPKFPVRRHRVFCHKYLNRQVD